MAIVQNTLIGRSKGRVGNAVFTTWKGRNVLKQKPEIVTNPRSALQQQQRSKFTTLMAIGKSLRPVLQLGFKEYAGTVSWLNRFISTNTGSGLLDWDEVFSVWKTDFKNLVISEGSLHPTFVNVDSVEAGVIVDGVPMTDVVLAWDMTPISNQSVDDSLIVTVMSGGSTVYSIRKVARGAGGTTIEIKDRPFSSTDQIYVSAFFISVDGRIVSGNSTVSNV